MSGSLVNGERFDCVNMLDSEWGLLLITQPFPSVKFFSKINCLSLVVFSVHKKRLALFSICPVLNSLVF